MNDKENTWMVYFGKDMVPIWEKNYISEMGKTIEVLCLSRISVLFLFYLVKEDLINR